MECYCNCETCCCDSLMSKNEKPREVFGCFYATQFFSKFENTPDPNVPIFSTKHGYLYQSYPLILKCQETINKILDLNISVQELKDRLGDTMKYNSSIMAKSFNLIKAVILKRLRNFKNAETDRILRDNLADIHH